MPMFRRGANALEFALVLPVLFFLMAAVLDFGVYFDTRRDVVNAVRDGTRAAVAHPVLDEIVDFAEDRTRATLSDQGLTFASVDAEISGPEGSQVLTVRAHATYRAPIGIVPSPPDYAVSYTMMLEQQ